VCDDQPVIQRLRVVAPALVGLAVAGGVVATGLASSALADPAPPVPTYPVPAPPPPPPPPSAPALAPAATAPIPGDPTAPPPPRDPFTPYVPEIPNQSYGSGNSGGGVFGTLKDLLQQVQNPTYAPSEIAGSGGPGAPLPISAPVPALPPGYVSINLPGSETPAAPAGSEAASSGPALPPGYYPLNGPPPPGYEYVAPSAGKSPSTPTTAVPDS
jgi:hypothetical protein